MRSGDLIDGVVFETTVNGKAKKTVFGGDGGAEREPLVLEEGEYIIAVCGKENSDSCTRVWFETNLGRTSDTALGGSAGSDFALRAEPGQMVVGIKGGSGW